MTYLDALQEALATEHAALFVVGYLGAQTSASAQPDLYAALSEAYVAHRSQRDRLIERVRAAGGEPLAAAAAYEIDDVGGDPDHIRRRALALERACTAAYGFLVAHSPAPERRDAVEALLAAALRELTFGGRPRPLPGA